MDILGVIPAEFSIRSQMEELESVNEQLLMTISLLEDAKKQLESAQDQAKELQGGNRKKPKTKSLVSDLSIYSHRLDRSLNIARSGPWSCCAKRIVCSSPEKSNFLLTELAFLEEIQHPNILPILDTKVSESHINMMVTWPSMTLIDYLRQKKFLLEDQHILPPSELTQALLDIALGLEYLHKNQVVHRAVKHSQIYLMMKSQTPKLCLAPYFIAKKNSLWSVDEANAEYYEPVYAIAPEVHDDPEQFSYYADIWSFGMVLYEMLTLQPPFLRQTPEQIKEFIRSKPVTLPAEFQHYSGNSSDPSSANFQASGIPINSTGISEEILYQNLVSLFECCTKPDPWQRPPISEIVRCLNSGENIKELCGLKLKQDSQESLKEWTSVSSLLQLQSCSKDSRLIRLCEKHVIESCVSGCSTLIEDGTKFDSRTHIQYYERNIKFYERFLAQTLHENYYGGEDGDENLVVLSMETDPVISGDQYCWKTLVRMLDSDLRVVVTCDNPKDRIKALKSHPILGKIRNLVQVRDPGFVSQLLEFESNLVDSTCYKFGVIYRKSGQLSDDEMYSNEFGSHAFNEFLLHIGSRIPLKNWPKFRGGLDIQHNTTGTESVYATLGEFEIMFHVSTLLPFDPENPQQLHRKRHGGNDIVVIIFQDEGSDPFTPAHFASHFNHAFVVVSPFTDPASPNTKYQ